MTFLFVATSGLNLILIDCFINKKKIMYYNKVFYIGVLSIVLLLKSKLCIIMNYATSN